MTSTPTPTAEKIRLTITVTPEVHETFSRMAAASGMSLGRAMGEWLGDTQEAAQFMAMKMEQARAAPKVVMAEMHAYALGLADETGAMIERVRKKGMEDRAALARDALGGPPLPIPPSGNTGGKGPAKRQGKPVARPIPKELGGKS